MRPILPVLLLTAALTLAACGGDEGGSSEALDRAAVSAKLDAICKTANDAATKVTPPDDISDPKVAADYFGKILPITQKETDDIEALEGDDAVKADLDAVKAAQNEANELLKTINEKAENADASGAEDLAKVQPVGEKFAAAAKKAGAKGCG